MFIIEGNIGAGKSTILKLLQQHLPDAHCQLEPLSKWDDGNETVSLLKSFYQEPKRWAYTLENTTLSYRSVDHQKLEKIQQTVICERSIYSGFYCFAKNSYDSGFMNELEWHLHAQWATLLMNECRLPKGFIYLDVSPEECLKRIKKRNRSSEESLSLRYLYDIDAHHRSLFVDRTTKNTALNAIPVLHIDAHPNIIDDIALQEEIVKKVTVFTSRLN